MVMVEDRSKDDVEDDGDDVERLTWLLSVYQ